MVKNVSGGAITFMGERTRVDPGGASIPPSAFPKAGMYDLTVTKFNPSYADVATSAGANVERYP